MQEQKCKKKIHNITRLKIRNLNRDIEVLEAELERCVSFLQDDCEHPSVISHMITKYGPGDDDVWRHPYRFCTVCGKSEEGWYDKMISKIPEGRTLSSANFEKEHDKALKDLYNG